MCHKFEQLKRYGAKCILSSFENCRFYDIIGNKREKDNKKKRFRFIQISFIKFIQVVYGKWLIDGNPKVRSFFQKYFILCGIL